jgi:hypothetical protein
MAETIFCDNCGAALAPEDEFCGECGAPRPTLTQGAVPARRETPPASYEGVPPAALPSTPRGRSEGRRTAAKIIAILAAVVAVGLCGLGLILAFVTPVQDATTQDMLLVSTLFCFCPGALALILALVLWAVAGRRK